MAIINMAKVENGIVTNMILADDAAPISGYIECPLGTGVGFDYDGTVFTAPVPPTPTALTAPQLAAYRLEIESKIDGLEKIYRREIFQGDIDGFRAYEYIVSLLEAEGVLVNNDYPHITGTGKGLLTAKASKKPASTESDEATIVDSTYVQFRTIIGETSGIRGKHKDVLKDEVATTDKAGCDAVVVDYVTEMDAYIAGLP